MSNQNYFVKIRGRVIGPLPPARLKEMVQRGQLSRVNQISTDGNVWQSAADFPGLFQTEPERVQTFVTVAKDSDELNLVSDPDALEGIPTRNQWHYGINEQSTGPITKAVMIDLIRKGELGGTDMVWHSGMADWLELQSVTELAQHLPNRGAGKRKDSPGTYEGRSSASSNRIESTTAVTNGNHLANDYVAVLKGSNAWVYFIFILLYIASAGSLVSFVITMIWGFRADSTGLILQSIAMLIQAGILFALGFMLQKYAINSSRMILSQNSLYLLDALRWLGRFWTIVGIALATIIIFMTALAIFVTAFAGRITP